ncbi:MAG: ABC transporter substrate-binding protein [Chloroflexota bacterium]
MQAITRLTIISIFLSLLLSCGSPQELPQSNDESPDQHTETSHVSEDENTEDASVVSSSDDAVRIGALVALDGVFEGPGGDGVRGIEMAIAEFGGEVAGKPIELVLQRTNASYDLAYSSAEKLIEQDQVDFIIGPLSGDEGLAVKEYAKTQPNYTFINGTSAAQDMTLRDPSANVFRFSTDGVQWMAGLGNYVYNEQKYERIVTIGEDYSFIHGQVGGFLVEYCEAGGSVEEQFWVPLGTKNYSAVVSAIPADIDAIYVGLGGTDAVDFLRQYKRFGGTAPLIGSTVTLDQSILSEASVQEFVLGAASAGPTADDNQDPAWISFVETYRTTYPDGFDTPSLFAWGYYVNTKAALIALENVDADLSDDQQAFQSALAEISIESPTGTISLDMNRHAVGTNYLTVVAADENGQLFRKLVKATPNVNQTLNLPRDEYLALGEFSGTYEGCDQFMQKAAN